MRRVGISQLRRNHSYWNGGSGKEVLGIQEWELLVSDMFFALAHAAVVEDVAKAHVLLDTGNARLRDVLCASVEGERLVPPVSRKPQP
eukprot:3057108-Lingulodinium_polyedra.AAC.1